MFTRLPVASLTLGELLSGGFRYAIPPFQRPYSWEIEQATQMLDDLSSAAGLDAPELAEPDYFLGTVLLLAEAPAPLPEPNMMPRFAAYPSVYQVIDGQQRLTTLTILAALLRDFEIETGAPRSAVATLIGDEQIEAAQTTPAVPPYLLVLSGRERAYFLRTVQRPGGTLARDDVDPPATQAARRIGEVVEVLRDRLAAMDQNARLTLSDYIRNRCHVVVTLSHEIDRAHRIFSVINERGKPLQRNDILKVEVLGNADEGSDTASLLWDEVEQLLGGDFEAFFTHLRSIHRHNEARVVASVRRLIDDVGGPDNFLLDVMLPYAHIHAEIAAAIRSPEASGLPYADSLFYLGRLNGAEWLPAVMLTMRKYRMEPDIARSLILGIDRLEHALRIMCVGSGKRKSRLAQVVRAIHEGSATSAEHDVFTLARDEQRLVSYNLRTLHRRNPQMSKFLLFRINDVIDGRVANVDTDQYSVEHVMPLRPPAQSEWRRRIPNPELREAATDCLGNLTLLPGRLNERVRNRDYAVKRGMIADGLSPDTTLPITRQVIDETDWSFETIAARDAKMLEVVTSIVGIDVTDAALGRNGGGPSVARRP
ncbi:MAG: DUF262 domain-containing protein [Hyphomicrobiaceae bacterium]